MSHRLAVYFIMDNSPALSKNDLLDFLDGVNTVIDKQEIPLKSKELHLSIFGFNGFEPMKIYDSFENISSIETINVQRFPLLGRTISMAAKDLNAKLKGLTDFHTPWVFIITSGLSVDALTSTHHDLEQVKESYGLRYMPFLLNTRRYQNNNAITNHFQNKSPLVIAEGKMAEFFAWFNDDITKRLATPAAQAIKSNKELIQGWAVR